MRKLVYLFGVSLVWPGFHALAADDGYWISDAKGCKVVLNPTPQPRVTVTWSGACPEGVAQGRGILEWIVDGKTDARLDIKSVDGKADGEGSYTTAGGIHFQGNFIEEKINGKGVMTWPNGDRYEGDWSTGSRTGRGVLTRSNGDRYEGDFVNGKWSGKGTATFASGNRYDGDWVDNNRDGKGVQVYADGGRYEGEFKADKRVGAGEQTWPDGSRYKGLFVDDKPANPELIVRKSYPVRDSVTGSHIARDSIAGSSVPSYKTYASLTTDEKKRIKSQFGLTAEADEPPYPRYGPLHIYQELQSIEQRVRVAGVLRLEVTIDATGKPIAVDVSQSPDQRITTAIHDVLMLEKFKPAKCNGVPCQMQYPLVVNLQTNF